MEISVIPMDGWIEQHGLRSGPIVNPANSAFGPHGLLFLTAHPDASKAAGMNVDPADLLGATIQDPASGNSFEIFGGYFTDKSSGSVVVSQVFGIAANPAQGFNIGGAENKILVDEWRFEDIGDPATSDSFMDERSKGESGWALIVTHFPDRDADYPPSGGGIGITKIEEEPCAVIVRIDTDEDRQDDGSLKVSFTAVLQDPSIEFESYEWIFGDGNTGSGRVVEHTYASSPTDKAYDIKVTGTGPGDCSGNAIISVSNAGKPSEPIPCPKIKEIHCDDVKADDKTATYTFTVILENEKLAFDSYEWDFGGQKVSGSKTQAHTFDKGQENQRKIIDVKASTAASSSNPNGCEDSARIDIMVPGLTPEPEPEKPAICRWLWMLAALMAGLFISAMVIAGAHVTYNQDSEAVSNAPFFCLTIVTLLFLAMMVIWHVIGGKNGCPPTFCNYIEIGWSGTAAAILLSFFLTACFANSGMLITLLGVILVFLLLAWVLRCRDMVSTSRAFTLFGIGIVAFLVAYFLMAQPLLACC